MLKLSEIYRNANWKLFLLALALAVMAACGTNAEAKQVSQPTEPPEASPTFVSIQVTTEPESSTTESADPEAPKSTRGASRAIPELLTKADDISIGQLLSSWENYLFSGVLEFENNSWDLCNGERGTARGDQYNTDILWTIGPPRVEMQAGEVLLEVWAVGEKSSVRYVIGYENDSAVLKETSGFDLYDVSKPWEYVGDPIPFEMYELLVCNNL